MNLVSSDPVASETMQSSVLASDEGVVGERAPPPALASPAEPSLRLPTPTAPETVAKSVSGIQAPTPSPIATLIAWSQGQDVAAAEATLARFREACRRGDHQVANELLTEQATLLHALGLGLLKMSVGEKNFQHSQVYTTMSLRAFEQARKALSALGTGRSVPRGQTNVQVNVGAQPHANEIFEVPRE